MLLRSATPRLMHSCCHLLMVEVNAVLHRVAIKVAIQTRQLWRCCRLMKCEKS